MDVKEFCIATITWARNTNEENELKESLQVLAALNIPVFITDGGSGDGFLNFIRSISNFTLLPQIKGVQAQAGNSLAAAYKTTTPFIFYTEPDKKQFFSSGLPKLLAQVKPTENTGIIMASRNNNSFSSFPAFQQLTETAINNCCAELMGKKQDYTYGPFLMSRQIVPYLYQLKEDVGWGWRPYVFNLSKRLGYLVENYEGEFVCPAGQKQDDERERLYRMKQLEQNIRGLIRSTEVSL